MKDSLNINLVYQKTLELSFFTITCNAYHPTTHLISYGTKEGSIIYSYKCNSKLQFRNRNITDAPIYNLSWLDDHQLACSFGDSAFAIFDIQLDKILIVEEGDMAIRFIKGSSPTSFYTCSRDKLARQWDIRTMKPVSQLEHGGTVTCIEFNGPNILYTASTPGTHINFWDTRYTRRGKNFATRQLISNASCRDLLFYSGNLYSKNILSQVHKISQTTKFNNLIINNPKNSHCGSISFNEKYDSLFTCLDEEVYFIKNEVIKKVEVDFPHKSIGCISYMEDFILLNDNQNIFVYEINPINF